MMFLLIVGLGIASMSFELIFTAAATPKLVVLDAPQDGQHQLQCYQNNQPVALDRDGQLEVLVWNIYKQNRANWQASLERYSQGSDLVLLQEASLTDELRQWINASDWNGNAVDAFKVFDTSAGVLNLARELPSRACAYIEVEPWLRLPKSGLYATYPLSDGRELAVVNIHAINFTYGTHEYRTQIERLTAELESHPGPVILGGDFNSWSQDRMAVMQEAVERMGLVAATFTPDARTEFITGLALDHIYYRGLTLESAEAPETDASDHNPLLARFRL
ncbi:endonuclease/exonuclease/phosphatase family protein [Vibrio sp. WXL210]|uniref:endonuclease/exonuclease/phosphatase family protein n=1 Tax=Vibrio sp. WXL210 TaxID=3450709 RepID=UPI003EC53731